MIATVTGNMRPAANSEYIRCLALNGYRAITKLAMRPSTTTPTVVPTAAITEFTNCRQKTSPVSTPV